MDPDWSTLPDVCLLLIFKKLPLALLFGTLSLVCQKWNQLVQVCLRNHTELVLIGDTSELDADIKKLHIEANPIGSEFLANALRDANVEDSAWAQELVSRSSIEFNLIRVPGAIGVSTLTERIASSILSKFTSLTHLTVVLSWFRNEDSTITSLGQLARIIDHYADRLVSLKLDLNYHVEFSQTMPHDTSTNIRDKVRELFNSINQVTQLDHLTLNVHFDEADLQPGDFAFLSQVRTFVTHQFVTGFHPDELLLASLVEHATDGRCNEIDIDLVLRSKHLKELNPQLANKFRRIGSQAYDTIENIERDMQQFGDRFVSLTSLEIHLQYLPITEISKRLSRLIVLIHLNLDYIRGIPLEDNDDDDVEQLEITPLLSVRFLTLNLDQETHSDFGKLHLSEVFPNVQVLRNTSLNFRCVECKTGKYRTIGLTEEEAKNVTKKDDSKVAHCTSLLQKSFFRLFPSLRVLHYDTDVFEHLKGGLPIGLFTDGGRSCPPAYVPVEIEEDEDESRKIRTRIYCRY